ncbi:MAG: RNA polymerase sigma factor [Candidatus Dormibacteria bacterium]
MSSTATKPTDQELIENFRAGDVAAFEELYQRYFRFVHNLAYRVVGDPYRAEDLAQESFIKLLKHVTNNSDSLNLKAWLYRITTNLGIDEKRRNKVLIIHHEDESEVNNPFSKLQAMDSQQPEYALEEREIRRHIMEAVAWLPKRYRVILTLRELQGLNYPAIAEAMGLSVSAVESLLFRARRKFKEQYDRAVAQPAPGHPGRALAVRPAGRRRRGAAAVERAEAVEA